jgi:hypothetical protein
MKPKSFFLCKVPLANWQLSLLKFSALCFGLAIGAYFADYLKPFILIFLALSIFSGLWIGTIWFRNMSIVQKIIK